MYWQSGLVNQHQVDVMYREYFIGWHHYLDMSYRMCDLWKHWYNYNTFILQEENYQGTVVSEWNWSGTWIGCQDDCSDGIKLASFSDFYIFSSLLPNALFLLNRKSRKAIAAKKRKNVEDEEVEYGVIRKRVKGPRDWNGNNMQKLRSMIQRKRWADQKAWPFFFCVCVNFLFKAGLMILMTISTEVFNV